jgi:hypothetical protein
LNSQIERWFLDWALLVFQEFSMSINASPDTLLSMWLEALAALAQAS